jgi:antitoxin VapB
MTIVAKVFMSGRSQAVRWPAKLRLQAQEVILQPMAGGVWVKSLLPHDHDLGLWLKQFYESTEPLPPEYLSDRLDAPAQERDWS